MKATKQKLSNETIDAILDALPHGSGIDCTWRHHTVGFNREVFTNSFHMMDENGFYDGWQPFKVEVFFHAKDKFNPLGSRFEGKVQVLHRKGDLDWDLKSVGGWCWKARHRNGLPEYLSDIIAYSLEKLVPYISHPNITAEEAAK